MAMENPDRFIPVTRVGLKWTNVGETTDTQLCDMEALKPGLEQIMAAHVANQSDMQEAILFFPRGRKKPTDRFVDNYVFLTLHVSVPILNQHRITTDCESSSMFFLFVHLYHILCTDVFRCVVSLRRLIVPQNYHFIIGNSWWSSIGFWGMT